MAAPQSIPNLSRIAHDYDAMLCDAWGVIHNGVSLFSGIEEALVRFRRSCGPVVILTNAPRRAEIIPPQLDRLGLSREAYDAVVTSGDATRAQIEARAGQKAFRLGPEKDASLYEGLDVEFSPLEDADYIICTGLVDDQTETPDAYRDMLSEAAKAGAPPMICANPDIVVNWGGRTVYCAGALAEIYAEAGGVVAFSGKPHPPIYALARRAVADARGGAPASRLLAVGDGLETDIRGANNENVDALFIHGAGGVHRGEAACAIADLLDEKGLTVRGVASELAW